jgi:hypothetical protein
VVKFLRRLLNDLKERFVVAELEALLAERGLALDYQLFRESDQVDAQLRDELHQWVPAATLAFSGPAGSSRYYRPLLGSW